MSRRIILETASVVVCTMVATMVIALAAGDIKVSSFFSISGSWPLTNLFPWRQLYLLDRTPAIILVVSALFFAAYSYKNKELKSWRKAAVFLLLFLIIGPGLIVNAGLKDHWGRPRPREIIQFGGKKEFLQTWQKGVSGGGRSFPSGHSSAAFFMIAPFFIYRRSKPSLARNWLVGGVLFGVLMSITRIVQGAHFLSDNLWAFSIIYLVGLWLSAAMKLDAAELLTERENYA